MIPHNLPPVPGKVYQFTTSLGIVRFFVQPETYTFYVDGIPEKRNRLRCIVRDDSGMECLENLYSIDDTMPIELKQFAPRWIAVNLLDNNDGRPEYPYTLCNEV